MNPSRRRVSILVLERADATLFRVRDWGPGIDTDAAGHIFDRDFSTKPGHSGIGLSYVESIVKRCRGAIAVEQPSGGGTSISVTLPQ
jgi:signal transduction histidine kinase